MTRPIVFLDTETTGLQPGRHLPWEVAAIVVDPASGEVGATLHRFLPLPDGIVEQASPEALEVGGFHARYPKLDEGLADPWHLLDQLDALLDGAHLAGAAPAFDARMLTAYASTWGRAGWEPWHHRLIDVEVMASGWSSGRASCGIIPHDDLEPGLPVSLSRTAAALGIPTDEDGRHTAMGDTVVAQQVWRRIRSMLAQP